jgi:hypothetical protein
MNIKITCDNDKGINALGEIETEHVPSTGDIIVIDGVSCKVTGRTFAPSEGKYALQISLHAEGAN